MDLERVDNEEIANCKSTPSEYFRKDLIYNAIQLNDHLAKELSYLQELKKSDITDRLIRLAEATAKISVLALIQISDVDAIVKDLMSE